MATHTAFWPGTNIKKSTGNAFSLPERSLMDTPEEKANISRAEAGKKGREGYEAKTTGGLSKRAQRELTCAPHSIVITHDKTCKTDRIKRGGR